MRHIRDLIDCSCWFVLHLCLALLLTYLVAVVWVVPMHVFPVLAKIPAALLVGCGALQAWLAAYDDVRDLIGR